jgi:hypothetical protein
MSGKVIKCLLKGSFKVGIYLKEWVEDRYADLVLGFDLNIYK